MAFFNKDDMSTPEHTKIINKILIQTLKSEGLEREGKSRTWLDDQKWYTTIVEFQPFKDLRGTCLNVGVCFHWSIKEYYSFDIGGRESDFIDFNIDPRFDESVEHLAKQALEKVKFYRHALSNLIKAKETIVNHSFTSENLWGSYHKGIICGLTDDIGNLRTYFNRILALALEAPFEKELEERVKHLLFLSQNEIVFKETIENYIQESRKRKKLKEIKYEF